MNTDITVSAIQTELFWEDKSANLQMFENKFVALRGATDIVVLPEMFSTGFSMNPAKHAESIEGETIQWMKRISKENKVILTGSLIIEEEGKYYNSLIWMLPDGTFGQYNKRHLFGYAEEDKHYSQGRKRLIASVNGWKINLQVCYDLRFPVWARQATIEQPEYDVLIYVANWPERRNHAWKSLLVARAIENQCYVVGVNRVGNDNNDVYHSGDSMIIDPMGIVVQTAAHDSTILTHVLSKKVLLEFRDQFPFLKDGDDFQIL